MEKQVVQKRWKLIFWGLTAAAVALLAPGLVLTLEPTLFLGLGVLAAVVFCTGLCLSLIHILRPQKVHLEALLSADGPGAGSAEAAPMIRPARPDDLPALGPVYGVARRFMAEHGNPTQWSDRYPLPEDLEADLQRGEL